MSFNFYAQDMADILSRHIGNVDPDFPIERFLVYREPHADQMLVHAEERGTGMTNWFTVDVQERTWDEIQHIVQDAP